MPRTPAKIEPGCSWRSTSSAKSPSSSSRCSSQKRGEARAAQLLLALAYEHLAARAGCGREREDRGGQRALGVGGAAADDVPVAHLGGERLDGPLRPGRLHVVHAVAQDGRAWAVDHADDRRPLLAGLARRGAAARQLDQAADGVGGASAGRRRRPRRRGCAGTRGCARRARGSRGRSPRADSRSRHAGLEDVERLAGAVDAGRARRAGSSPSSCRARPARWR